MHYTKLTCAAMKIAFAVHKDQVDKGGIPYIFHPFHLAEQMDDEESICAALLHDTIEDGAITLNYLKERGFPDSVIDAVSLLTHSDEVPYLEYVMRIRDNPIARKVKVADLRHNSDLTRLSSPTQMDYECCDKYRAAMEILMGE